MKKILIAFLCCIVAGCIGSTLSAQNNNQAQREQWYRNMIKTKIEFLAKEMNLTPDQRTKFEKQYTAMSNETAKLSHETRSLSRTIAKKSDATDLEYDKAAEAMAEFKLKEGAIELKYHNQFKTYLNKRQLFKLKRGEHKWMKELMKHRGKRRK